VERRSSGVAAGLATACTHVEHGCALRVGAMKPCLTTDLQIVYVSTVKGRQGRAVGLAGQGVRGCTMPRRNSSDGESKTSRRLFGTLTNMKRRDAAFHVVMSELRAGGRFAPCGPDSLQPPGNC
jgi:hypothetical protein